MHWLNYSIKVSVECWPHCYVRYCFINRFSTSRNDFASNDFYWRFLTLYFFQKKHFYHFYRAACNATHGIAVAILSVRRVYCDKTKQCSCGYFDTIQNVNHSSSLTPTLIGGECPLPCQIFTEKRPTPSKNADFDRILMLHYSTKYSETKKTSQTSREDAESRQLMSSSAALSWSSSSWLFSVWFDNTLKYSKVLHNYLYTDNCAILTRTTLVIHWQKLLTTRSISVNNKTKRKGKEEYLYSAILADTTYKALRHGSPTLSPGWGPRGQGPIKNHQGPGKNNWTVHVQKSKKTKWQPCVVCSMEAGADGWVTLTLIPAVTRLTA